MHEAHEKKKNSYLLAYCKLFYSYREEKTIMTLQLAISLATASNLMYYFISAAKFQEASEGCIKWYNNKEFQCICLCTDQSGLYSL